MSSSFKTKFIKFNQVYFEPRSQCPQNNIKLFDNSNISPCDLSAHLSILKNDDSSKSLRGLPADVTASLDVEGCGTKELTVNCMSPSSSQVLFVIKKRSFDFPEANHLAPILVEKLDIFNFISLWLLSVMSPK